MSTPMSRRANIFLWVVQGILALLFLFAGGMKLTMPLQALAQSTGLSGEFMRFIALAEIAGALGLVVPGIFRIGHRLTPLAAAGLTVIMMGAVVVSVLRLGAAAAVVPAVVGVLLVVVVWARSLSRVGRFRSPSFDVSLKAGRTQPLHSRG